MIKVPSDIPSVGSDHGGDGMNGLVDGNDWRCSCKKLD
jgi:hypothetical protein